MTEKQLKYEVLACLENAASIGKSQQPYGEYVKKLTESIMLSVEKYKLQFLEETSNITDKKNEL